MSHTGNAETGRSGEDLANSYLQRHGCSIVARNWLVSTGEVDIVAECPAIEEGQERELAFIEVRTRGGRRGLAEESISERKASAMIAAAYAYMAAHNLDPEITPWRIDLLALSVDSAGNMAVNWVKSAIEEF